MSGKPPPSPRLRALLAAALGGDAAAQQALLREVLIPVIDAAVSRSLFGRATRYFEREDAVQGIVLHLIKDNWAKLRRYDPSQGPIEGWLHSVSQAWIRDGVRAHPPPEPIQDPEKESTPDSGPEKDAQILDLVRRLRQALSPEDLLLFRWFYIQGLTRQEIAGRLGVSMAVVYKRLQDLEKIVRSILSNS